jgi:hypothetical protein
MGYSTRGGELATYLCLLLRLGMFLHGVLYYLEHKYSLALTRIQIHNIGQK